MDFTIRQGDALDLFSDIDPGHVDAVITDPPYMIGATSIGVGNAKCGKWADMENSALWYTAWIKESVRVLKPTGFICSCLNWRSLPVFTLAFALDRYKGFIMTIRPDFGEEHLRQAALKIVERLPA